MRNVISNLKREEGFTLIELMIVMVVLGILAGIVLFAVGSFDDEATTAQTEANDRICRTANAAALARYGDTYDIDDVNEFLSTADADTCAVVAP